ncbi:ATP-binding protein [Planotetraspora kaengkrachanensis]|uniref:Uncharacterized protein n=1 Tax=Planotetraspora kaengkrachanensis TaxID=575193 RepID=A0A8J3M609_9ACTN|nr:ATP-binding protein [Planotetraspora kaengkrachanensis]GIG79975.1 hypothetical protein Pka01_31020 [Planotetraspora kaengkrachanensis]
MTHASTRSAVVIGGTGHVLGIEADAAPGDGELRLIGLPEPSVWPTRARVRAAILNGGMAWGEARVTVSVCPTLPTYGSAADLALAVAALAAAGVVPPEQIARVMFLGELGLNGVIRQVRGVLPAIHTAVRAEISTVVIPAAHASEVAQIAGVAVIPGTSLTDMVSWLRDGTLHDHACAMSSAPASAEAAGGAGDRR